MVVIFHQELTVGHQHGQYFIMKEYKQMILYVVPGHPVQTARETFIGRSKHAFVHMDCLNTKREYFCLIKNIKNVKSIRIKI